MTAIAKLDRARRHFDELSKELHSFIAAKPCKIGARHDRETRKLIYYLTAVTEVPLGLSQS